MVLLKFLFQVNNNFLNYEVYLLNISDGLPNINNMKYNFGTAINHTKKVVSSYKKGGIGVLSYFIHDTWDKGQKGEDSFKKMYGKKKIKTYVRIPEKYSNCRNIHCS